MPGATVEALRRYRAGEPASPAAPLAIVRALRDWREQNAQRTQQNLDDSKTMARTPLAGITDEPTSREFDEAQARSQDYMSDAMDVGGLTAWHGSPYRFTKFDPSKIGTGEGAQAFGQGFYAAQRRGIGEDYRKNLSARSLLQKIREVGLANDGKLLPGDAGYNQLVKSGKLAPDEVNLLTQFKNQGWYGYQYPHEALVGAVKTPDIVPMSAPAKQAMKGLGNIYQLDIPDPMVAKMIDWDKDLFSQNRVMQQIGSSYNDPEKLMLRKAVDKYEDAYHGSRTPLPAGNLMTNLLRRTPESAGPDSVIGRALARDLSQSDIPGVRYLDGPSRKVGGGMSNFVVFPDNSSKIRIDAINDMPFNSWGSMP